jgi:hypothetical protein
MLRGLSFLSQFSAKRETLLFSCGSPSSGQRMEWHKLFSSMQLRATS